MKITSNGNIHLLSSPLTKSRKLNKVCLIKKSGKESGFYLKLLADVLQVRTTNLNKTQFNQLKNDLYDARFFISIQELKDYVIFEYAVDYISDAYLKEPIEDKVMELFNDFCSLYDVDVDVVRDILPPPVAVDLILKLTL